MTTINKTDTWLPVFSGFYETIWETYDAEEQKIEHINEIRVQNGLGEISRDDIDWNYSEYAQDVARQFTRQIEDKLKTLGMIKACAMQKLVSPREYNYRNDSVNVEITLSASNVKTIEKYLDANLVEFQKYLRGTYSSYDGFISRHSNSSDAWISDLETTLADSHKAGSVLQFILLNENPELEMEIHEKLSGNGCVLGAKNYAELTGGK